MGRLTRRAFLRAAWGTGTLLTGGLLAACGQPRPTATIGAARPAIAGTSAAGTPVVITPQVTVYPPLPTVEGTVLLPTAERPPNHQTVTLKTPIPNLPTPTIRPTARPEDPICSTLHAERAAPLAYIAHESPLVIIATVTTIFPARWTTPDGQRPANPRAPGESANICTPVGVQIEQTLKGTPTASLLILTPVGIVGRDCSLISAGIYDFTIVGERVVLFLGRTRTYEPKQLDGIPLWRLEERYTVTTDGQAKNVYDTRPLDELIAIVGANAGSSAVPTTPSGTPTR